MPVRIAIKSSLRRLRRVICGRKGVNKRPELAAGAREAASCALVPRAQRERAAVGSGCVGLVAQPLIGGATAGPGQRAVRIGLYRFVEIGDRFLGLVEREVTVGAGEQWFGLLRRQAIGCGEILDRLLMLLFRLTDQAATVERPHIVGIKRQGALEFGERCFVVAGLGENLAVRRIALGVTDAAGADIVGRLRLGLLLRLFLVRSPGSKVERASAKR